MIHRHPRDEEAQKPWEKCQVTCIKRYMNAYRWRGGGGERSSVHHGRSPRRLGLLKHNQGLVQGKPEPALTLSFVKKKSFKPILKCRVGVCLPDPKRN